MCRCPADLERVTPVWPFLPAGCNPLNVLIPDRAHTGATPQEEKSLGDVTGGIHRADIFGSSYTTLSRSPRVTFELGRKLGGIMRGGEIIGLVGELGTGKTSFVRGVAAGAGVGEAAWVRSPTFTLVNEYHGRVPIYHIDLYRIVKAEELDMLNLREYLYAGGVSLIEWFENLPFTELAEYLEIKLAHMSKTVRELTFTAYGARYETVLKELRARG